jgi:hypothetical protein
VVRNRLGSVRSTAGASFEARAPRFDVSARR